MSHVRPRSMTRRLVFGFGGSFAILSVVSGLLVYVSTATQLNAQRGLLQADRLQAVASLLKSPAHGLDELKQRIEKEWPARGGEAIFFDLVDGAGNHVASTPYMPVALQKAFGEINPRRARLTRQASDGERDSGRDEEFTIRSVQMESSVGLKEPVLVRVAIGQAQGLDFLLSLRDAMIAVEICNLLLSLLVGVCIVRRQMRPISSLVANIATIEPRNLHTRIDVPVLPLELQPVVGAFNHTLDRLEAAFEQLSRFSSDIAHELRTPIANIMGATEVGLNRDRSPSEYREILAITLEDCERIQSIVESLLFLARAEAKAERLPLKLVNLGQEIEFLLDFYGPLAAENGICLERVGLATDGPEISAEPILLQRAIGNLVANAICYTPRGGTVQIGLEDEVGMTRIFVRDSGRGIEPRHQKLIFDRFYRIDPSRNNESGGTGLGLAIAKSIVELHGGSISVRSEIGQGSVFTIEFTANSPV